MASSIASIPVDPRVVHIALAIALGLFLGLEREWSQKAAGIRTFALISVLGTIFTIYDESQCGGAEATTVICLPLLSMMGALFVTVLAGVLMVSGFRDDEGLNLTTGVSLLVAYGVGILVALDQVLPATVVTVASSLLLVFKRELHGFAWELSRQELRSASEFAILAFVVYPLLPAEPVGVGSGEFAVEVEPQVVWLMVVFVAGIGIVNYAIATTYGGRGVAITGFFGGLASSTAVVGTMLDHVSQRREAAAYGVAAILLADAAMALRNLAIAVLFTFPDRPLFAVAVPLGAVIVGSVVIAAISANWSEQVEMKLDTPFSMRNALGFGAMFLLVIVVGSLAQAAFGEVGFYVTAAFSGLVSSAGAVTSAVVLYRTGSLSYQAAVVSVMLATFTSIGVKAALAATSDNRSFVHGVAGWSAGLLTVATIATAVVLL